jgi:hypothetical protein
VVLVEHLQSQCRWRFRKLEQQFLPCTATPARRCATTINCTCSLRLGTFDADLYINVVLAKNVLRSHKREKTCQRLESKVLLQLTENIGDPVTA